MRLSKLSMAALVAFSMAGTPLLAQASSSASKPAVSTAASKSVRTDGVMAGESSAQPGSLLLAFSAISLMVLGTVIAVKGNSKPKSP